MMISFLMGMLATGASLLLFAAAMTGVGLGARRAFGYPRPGLDESLLGFWVGFSLVILFLILWNFILPIGLVALLIVLAGGALGLLWAVNAPPMSGREAAMWHPSRSDVVILIVLAIWVVNQCLAGFDSWDGGLYHLQAVKWAKAYPVVPGIANLHGPLAFNNSSFLYDAMVDAAWWEGRGFHVANGTLLLVAVIQAAASGLRWLHGDPLAASDRLFGFLMLTVAMHQVGQVTSYSTDLPAILLLTVASTTIYRLLDGSNRIATRGHDTFSLFALTLILAAAVSIKLTAGVFAALALPVAVVAWWRHHRTTSPRPSRALIGVALCLLVFATAWVARGIVMSGYPFFPVPIGGLPLEWRAPVEMAAAESANIAFTEREFAWGVISRNWLRLILFRDVFAVLVPACLAILALALWWFWRREPEDVARGHRLTWWLLPPALVAIGVWLMTAPSHRYAPALFWTVAALCTCESLAKIWPALPNLGKRYVSAMLVLITISPPLLQPAVTAMRNGESVFEAVLARMVIMPKPSEWVPHLNGEAEVTPFRTTSGLVLNVPARKPASLGARVPNACWNAPLPCTPNPAPNLRLRDPDNQAEGFSVDGNWQMQTWPYYWRPDFLPEWRQRHAGDH